MINKHLSQKSHPQKRYLRRLRFSSLFSINLSVIFLFLFFSATTVNAESGTTTEDKASLTEKQLKQVNKEIKALQSQLSKDKSSQKKEQNNLRKIEKELETLHKRSRELEQKQGSVKNKIASLKKEERSLENKNQQQKSALKKDLQSIYKIGRQEKIKLLLNQENPEEVARLLKYYDYYTEARVQRILDYQKNIKALTEKRIAIEQELKVLREVNADIERETLALKEKQKGRKSLLDKINAKIKNEDQKLKNLQQDQTRLSKLLRSLKGIWADIPKKLSKSAISKNKGKLKYPVKGKVKNKFGSQRVGGRLSWNGWLIDAPMNRSVKAIHDGRVVFSDWIRGYGLLIIIDHSEGYLSLYGHNASLLKETGDWIQAGETLATVGNSGGQHDVGLYFELRKDGRPLNPGSWLKK
jgi:septal ring factor EnvC (AmiA/AmiB activator)